MTSLDSFYVSVEDALVKANFDLTGAQKSWALTAALHEHLLGQGVRCAMTYDEATSRAWPVMMDNPQEVAEAGEAPLLLRTGHMEDAAASCGIDRNEFSFDFKRALGLVEQAWDAVQPPSEDPIRNAIVELRKQYLDSGTVSTHWDINNGLCSDFAKTIVRGLPSLELQDVEGANFMQPHDDPYLFDWPLLERHWNIQPPKGWTKDSIDEVAFTGHAWVTDGKKHYDAECPQGVDSFFDLPLFRRSLEHYATQDAAKKPSVRP